MQLRKLVFVVIGLFVPAVALAQYAPSPSQHGKLVKQKAKLLKLQLEITRLQTEAIFEIGNLDRICREVTLANHWPANVECNPQNLTFAAPPAPPLSSQAPSGPSATQQSLQLQKESTEQKKP